jgi:hypothetical protein
MTIPATALAVARTLGLPVPLAPVAFTAGTPASFPLAIPAGSRRRVQVLVEWAQATVDHEWPRSLELWLTVAHCPGPMNYGTPCYSVTLYGSDAGASSSGIASVSTTLPGCELPLRLSWDGAALEVLVGAGAYETRGRVTVALGAEGTI